MAADAACKLIQLACLQCCCGGSKARRLKRVGDKTLQQDALEGSLSEQKRCSRMLEKLGRYVKTTSQMFACMCKLLQSGASMGCSQTAWQPPRPAHAVFATGRIGAQGSTRQLKLWRLASSIIHYVKTQERPAFECRPQYHSFRQKDLGPHAAHGLPYRSPRMRTCSVHHPSKPAASRYEP